MEVKRKLHPHTVLCRLQYDNGYRYEGEIMEERVYKHTSPQALVYTAWPDRRINGYGKLIQPNGKVILGKWVDGKPDPKITIHKNGKRVYHVSRFLIWEANQVTYTEDHQFIPGGVPRSCRNEWNQEVLDNICSIENSIALQQQILQNAPIYEARIGDSKVVTDRVQADLSRVLQQVVQIKKKTTPKLSPIGQALHRAKDLIGLDGMACGDRVCAILYDLAPKLEKERRRVYFAYASGAVTALLTDPHSAVACKEATKRLMDYTDMAQTTAEDIIAELCEALTEF